MRRTICILILLCTALTATAQRSPQQRPGSGLSDLFEDLSGRNRFAWEYDVDFQYVLDNRAFGASWDGYTPSGTLHTVVLTPTAGFSIQQNRRVHHRLTAGIEFAYDMGVQSWRDLPRELILYYDGHARTRNGSFEGLAGIFPRRFLEGNYSEAFFSDSTKFNDRNLEGALLKWRSDRFYAEVGLDWTGKTSPLKRERVQVMSAGQWKATHWLSLGWTGSYFHYAGSPAAPGIVDNHLLEPWVKVDFSRRTAWQELSLQAGLMAAYQNDRVQAEQPEYLTGCEIVAVARRYSFSLENTLYFGDNLMPLYGRPDVAGIGYGHDLFYGNPFYRSDFYDRLEVAWAPQITQYLSLRVAARFHFHDTGFVGWQQQLTLRLSLDALRNRELPAGRCL